MFYVYESENVWNEAGLWETVRTVYQLSCLVPEQVISNQPLNPQLFFWFLTHALRVQSNAITANTAGKGKAKESILLLDFRSRQKGVQLHGAQNSSAR